MLIASLIFDRRHDAAPSSCGLQERGPPENKDKGTRKTNKRTEEVKKKEGKIRESKEREKSGMDHVQRGWVTCAKLLSRAMPPTCAPSPSSTGRHE